MPSSPAVTTSLPSGLNATARTSARWVPSTARGAPPDARQILAVPYRLELRPLALDELDLLPEGIGHDEDIGEDDGSVEIEPAQGLERYLGGKRRIEAKVEEGTGLGPDLAIFGEIASRLAHQPDWWRIDGFAT